MHFDPQTTFKGRVFMTHATKAIYRWLLSDYIKVRYGCVVGILPTKRREVGEEGKGRRGGGRGEEGKGRRGGGVES